MINCEDGPFGQLCGFRVRRLLHDALKGGLGAFRVAGSHLDLTLGVTCGQADLGRVRPVGQVVEAFVPCVHAARQSGGLGEDFERREELWGVRVIFGEELETLGQAREVHVEHVGPGEGFPGDVRPVRLVNDRLGELVHLMEDARARIV